LSISPSVPFQGVQHFQDFQLVQLGALFFAARSSSEVGLFALFGLNDLFGGAFFVSGKIAGKFAGSLSDQNRDGVSAREISVAIRLLVIMETSSVISMFKTVGPQRVTRVPASWFRHAGIPARRDLLAAYKSIGSGIL
jgi:hypothetical protein